jgi:serine/threonine protein kinase
MNTSAPDPLDDFSPESAALVNAACDRFEDAWRAGKRPPIKDYLPTSLPEDRKAVLVQELVVLDVFYRQRAGESPRADEYLAQFPSLDQPWLSGAVEATRSFSPDGTADPLATPNQHFSGDTQLPQPPAVTEPPLRYKVLKVLGEGGFGIVYLAYDEQLQRQVAIKVQHPRLADRPEVAPAYLAEARAVATLDHANIVPVYDFGSTPEWPCFMVSKYIEGTNLAARLKQGRLSLHEAVELVATVAEALHHAHQQGFVHRDVKPGNILLDTAGKPFVADFGLALKEENVGRGPRFTGTPAYMSPELARGEGHQVDGRSDIFSLGVVFYELLTGRRPFHGETTEELLEQITSREARPPRQWLDNIPRELERICLKALAKSMAQRYTTARDMAEDLRAFKQQTTDPGSTGGKTNAGSKRLLVVAAGLALLVTAGVVSMALLGRRPALPPADPRVLTVTQQPADGARFRTISEALDAVEPGMTIRVLDDAVYSENVNVTKRHRGVVLEAAPGKKPVLRMPEQSRYCVKIVKVADFTLRGFRIESAADKGEVVYVRGACPGLNLSRLQVVSQDRPHRGSCTAISFDDVPLSIKDKPIVIEDCAFDGCDRGVFLNARHNFKANTPQPVANLLIRNNTMTGCGYGVVMFGAPPADFCCGKSLPRL